MPWRTIAVLTLLAAVLVVLLLHVIGRNVR